MSPQDYVSFIPLPLHYAGTPSAFSPSINECWYGRGLQDASAHGWGSHQGMHVTMQLGRWAMPVGTGTLDMMHSKSVSLAYCRIRKNTKIYSHTQFLHVYGSVCRYLYVLGMYIYVYVHMTVMLSYVAPGLRLFHPSATALFWNSICIQPFYW